MTLHEAWMVLDGAEVEVKNGSYGPSWIVAITNIEPFSDGNKYKLVLASSNSSMSYEGKWFARDDFDDMTEEELCDWVEGIFDDLNGVESDYGEDLSIIEETRYDGLDALCEYRKCERGGEW